MVGRSRIGGAGAPGAAGIIRLQSGFGPPTLCLPGRHRSPFLGPFARNSPAALRRNGDHGVGRDVLRRAARDPVRPVSRDRRLSRDRSRSASPPSWGSPSRSTRIAGGWDGWNPKLRISGLAIRDRGNPAGAPVLLLPQVDAVVAWTSVLVLDLRLKELTIERPELAVRRDTVGTAAHRGHRDRSGRAGSRPQVHGVVAAAAADRRPRRAADVDRRVARRAAARARPRDVPARAHARRIPVRPRRRAAGGDRVAARFPRRGFRHVAQGLARGERELLRSPRLRGRRAVARMDPVPAARGGRQRRAAGLVRLRGRPRDERRRRRRAHRRERPARAQPAAARPRPHGRARHVDGRAQATASSPARASRSSRGAARNSRPSRSRSRSRRARTARSPAAARRSTGWTSRRCRRSPSTCRCPTEWRRDLATFALRGSVSDGKFTWQGPPDAPTKFSGSGAFARFGIAASAAMPGAAGVSGSFTFDEKRGDLKLEGRDIRVTLPRVFAEEVILDSASGRVGWTRGVRRPAADVRRHSLRDAAHLRAPRAAAGARARRARASSTSRRSSGAPRRRISTSTFRSRSIRSCATGCGPRSGRAPPPT